MKIGVFTIYVVLLQMSVLFKSYFLGLIPMLFLFLAILQVVSVRKDFSISQFIKANALVLLFVLMGCIAIARTNYIGVDIIEILFRIVNLVLFIVGFLIITGSYVNSKIDNPLRLIIYYVIIPFALLALTNIVLYVLKVKFESVLGEDSGAYKALFLSYLGIDITRVEFPLSGGLSNYACYVGGIFMINIGVIITSRRYRNITLLTGAIFLITLLMIDTRAALLYPILIGVFLFFIKSKKRLRKWVKWLSVIVVLGPVLFLVLLPFVSTLPGFEFLARGDNDLKTGNSRFFIWVFALLEFANFKMQHIYGYGEYGHFGSGASKKWAFLFEGIGQGQYKTPHNTMFSLVFDYGYIGLLLYVAVIWQAIERITYLWNIQPVMAKTFFCYLLYHIFACITETLGGFYFPNYILLFYMVMLIIGMQYYVTKRNEKEEFSNVAAHDGPNGLRNEIVGLY